jgi:hypothetical protein
VNTTTVIALTQLDRLQIASPCSARWEDMSGDDRTRHCEQCSLKVHNISGMKRPEAEAFLAAALGPGASTGRVCARFFRRADGTIITADCPVGIAALRTKARRAAARMAAAVGLTTLVAWAAAQQSRSTPFAGTQPLATIAAWLRQPVAPPATLMGKIAFMGDIAPPPAAVNAPIQPGTATPGDGR